MKQTQLFLLGCACLLVSCGGKKEGGISATAQKNLDAFHGITKCIDSQDFTKIGDYIAADGVDHSDRGDLKGLEAITANMKTYGDMATDMTTEVVKELADDDYVMAWLKFKGTAKEGGMGMKAGEKYNMQGIEVARFKDGKVVEHWTFVDPVEMMKMINAGPNQSVTDTVLVEKKPAPPEK